MNTIALIQVLAEGEPQNSPMGLFIMIGLMFVVMWVVMIRPQQKRQKELAKKIDSLKKGDKVVTIGGLHGTINHLSKGTVSLKVGDGQYLTFDKKAVATILTDKKDEEKSDKKEEKK